MLTSAGQAGRQTRDTELPMEPSSRRLQGALGPKLRRRRPRLRGSVFPTRSRPCTAEPWPWPARSRASSPDAREPARPGHTERPSELKGTTFSGLCRAPAPRPADPTPVTLTPHPVPLTRTPAPQGPHYILPVGLQAAEGAGRGPVTETELLQGPAGPRGEAVRRSLRGPGPLPRAPGSVRWGRS